MGLAFRRGGSLRTPFPSFGLIYKRAYSRSRTLAARFQATKAKLEELSLLTYLMVMLGAALGGASRFYVGTVISEHFSGRFPLGTFVINVTGSFAIGLLMTILTEKFAPHPYWRLFLVVGFLGGYTTFSSFEWETLFAARNGAGWIALSYVVSSVAAGYAAVWLGVLVVHK
jgi:CrcB protein